MYPMKKSVGAGSPRIKAKARKLAGCRATGIVADDDAYVIAVNGCQLGGLPIHHGVSQLPYAVESRLTLRTAAP
jgi:hypothetical protein